MFTRSRCAGNNWIPACAGMTLFVRGDDVFEDDAVFDSVLT